MRKLFTRSVVVLSAVIFCIGCSDDSTNETVITSDVTVGCWSPTYNEFVFNTIGCGLVGSLGDETFDQQLTEEIAIQTTFWGIGPSVWLFDECGPEAKNALSLPSGNILFGINLFWDVIATTGSSLPAATVLAHEWAHQLQFQFGWLNDNTPTVRRTELEADAFSGYYMILAKSWALDQINAFYQSLYNIGDYNYSDRNHHGTPEERVNAGIIGVNTAIYAIQNATQYTYQDLHLIFTSQLGISTPGVRDRKPVIADARYTGVHAFLQRYGARIATDAYIARSYEERSKLFPSVGLNKPR